VREFGSAELGDERRTWRLVKIAEQAARRPAGKVTEVFAQGASREAAFRFVENEEIEVREIAAAAHRATVEKCAEFNAVFVPVDATSVSLIDFTHNKGLGNVGTRKDGAKGLHVMSAIAVAPDGTPLGLCGQRWWARHTVARAKGRKKLSPAEKETLHWLEIIDDLVKNFAPTPSVRPWLQIDRGADCWPVLYEAQQIPAWVTVRAAWDRRVMGAVRGQQEYLWPCVERQEPMGSYEVKVPATPSRKSRAAVMQLQAAPVELDLLDPASKRHVVAKFWAVRAIEVGTVPAGEAPIEWLLLTTFPVEDLAAAQQVALGYATRWRIEEFHKTWKSGACRIEDTQLRQRDHVERWATILASIAMRILRLKYLSRNTPDLPATVELNEHEIKAARLLNKPKKAPTAPTIGQVVAWLADIGGYVGKSSGGPPGAIVIARGLDRIAPVAQILADGEEL
jgi:Transposase DNA-binding/Transposase DDE domain